MNNSIKKTDVKSTSVKGAKVNKPYVMPKSLKAKIKASNEWKKEVFSLSGLYKYMQGDGLNNVQSFINSLDSNIQADKITKKAIISNLSDFERFVAKRDTNGNFVKNKDNKVVLTSVKKDKFSFYTLLNAVSRIVKASKS